MQFLENLWKHTYIKLVTTERRRNCLLSGQSYHTTKFFTENLLAIERVKKATKILMNRSVSI